MLAAALGMQSQEDAEEWWENRTAEEREEITKGLENTKEQDDNSDPHQDCMDEYENNMDDCKGLKNTYGSWAKRACENTAALRMAQCRKGVPEKDRRRPQTEY